MASIRAASSSVPIETPLTVQKCGIGTIESPCAPSTIAFTSFTEAPVASEMK